MKALPIAGPVIRPALDFSRRGLGDVPGYSRQPIGRGPRPVIRTDPASRSTRRRGQPPPARRALKRTTLFATTAAAILISLTALGIGATVDSPRSLMSLQDYQEARRALEAESRVALARCRAFEGAQKEVCRAQARGEDRVGRAELEARYRGTVAAEADVGLARARTRYEVARARCSERADADRGACLTAARAEKARALAEARPAAI